MPVLKVFCDYRLDPENLKLLREGIAPHELLFPRETAPTMLHDTSPDPAFASADIAFGQPDVKSILASDRLRWVQITSAGITRYDTPEFRAAAKSRGVRVTNSSSVFAEPCAEHVFSFMLAQARLLPIGLQTQTGHTSGSWGNIRAGSRNLMGQSVVILGYGTIAARLIELLAPLHMKITAMRRQPKGDETVPVFPPEQLREMLATADHVVDILPENTDSRGFVNAERFAWMKPGAIFYNIGRGATVDQDALVASLKSGHLAAAWLDVTDPEPLPKDHPLLTAQNCYITPHTAGGHGHEAKSLVLHFVENFRLYIKDAPLRDQVI